MPKVSIMVKVGDDNVEWSMARSFDSLNSAMDTARDWLNVRQERGMLVGRGWAEFREITMRQMTWNGSDLE